MTGSFWTSFFYPILHATLVLLFLGHILRLRRNPSSTLAWFLFVMLQPFLALPLYLIFGTRKIKHAPLKGADLLCEDANHLRPLQKMSMSSGARSPCFNENIHVLESSVIAYETLLDRIARAQQKIYLETFIFANDDVGNEVLSALTKKAQEGLDVRIILDSLGSFALGHPPLIAFKRAGGKFAEFMPLLHRPFRGRINLRNHRKMMIFDGDFALIGGMNIAKEYTGPTPDESRWIDLAMTIEGPLSRDLESTFLSDWAFATETTVKDFRQDISQIPATHEAQLITSGPDIAADPIYEWLLLAIYTAQGRVWMTTPYFIPDESLIKAIELAARRGVDVRVVIPDKSNHLLADLGRKSYLEQIDAAGVKILRLPRMIHAKLFLIDESCAFVGSANLDSRSLLINYEVGVALYSQQDVAQIERWWDNNIKDAKTGVEPSTIVEDWIGGLARLFSPLL